MKVVVVGGHGFIGTALTSSLLRDGYAVDNKSSTEKGGIDPQTGIFSPNRGWARKSDCFVHLSQSPTLIGNTPDPAHGLAVNVVSAVQSVMEAIRVGASTFVYASSGSVYKPSFDPLNESSPVTLSNWYAMSKVYAEQALRKFENEIDICILRLFGVYGPNQRMRLVPTLARKITNNERITLAPRDKSDREPDGFRISLTHVNDAVRIIQQVIQVGGCGTLNVAGDDALSIKEISTILGERLSVKPKFEVQDCSREGNLISDNAKLDGYYREDKTSFRDGIAGIVEF